MDKLYAIKSKATGNLFPGHSGKSLLVFYDLKEILALLDTLEHPEYYKIIKFKIIEQTEPFE